MQSFMFKSTVALLGIAVVAAPSDAAEINVGTHNVTVGDTAFEIPIYITSDTAATADSGILRFQVGEGTIGASAFVPDRPAPAITGVGFDGTIWADNTDFDATPGVGVGDFDQLVEYQIFADFSSPVAVGLDGLLTTLTIDASGFSAGESFSLKLDDTVLGDTMLSNGLDMVNLDITNGTINIVPEPATALLLAAGGIFAIGRRRIVR